MTPAQLQEHSTSSAADMQGKSGGAEPAPLPAPQPCAHIQLREKTRGAGSRQPVLPGDPLDNARAAWDSGYLSWKGPWLSFRLQGRCTTFPVLTVELGSPGQRWPGPALEAQPVQEGFG